jgi:hypothetical protein
VLARVHLVATVLWAAIAGGAAAGFLARDALGLRQPLVALAWTSGAVLALLPLARRRPRGSSGRARRSGGRGERGQATVELTALVLLVASALGALVAAAPRFDGRSFGGFLTFRIVCTIERDCHDGDRALAQAYGARDAALVRELAPNLVYEGGERQLPVDWRDCRRPACADAPDEADLDVHRSNEGERGTAFTRLLRRGRRTYLQYWLYYPDSKSVWAGSDVLWERAWEGARRHGLVGQPPAYPGAHSDDWEAYVVRLDPGGGAWVRASSHKHWQACKELRCKNRWTERTGWTRVSRGSHAGHIPLRHELHRGPRWVLPRQVLVPNAARAETRWVPLLPGHDLHERTTTGEGLRLVPLETLDTRSYRSNDDAIEPPWQKDAYWDPDSDDS